MSKEYDMVVLDEINVTVNFGLLKAEYVVDLLEKRPKDLELILTGRYMPEEFAQHADLITECRELKHYFNDGVSAREGFDY